MSCFTLSKVSPFPSALLVRNLRERHLPHAQADEHRPRPAMHGDRFLQDELGGKGAKDIDQRGCGKHNTEVGPGQDGKKPDEIHDHEHSAGEKVVIEWPCGRSPEALSAQRWTLRPP